MSAIFLILLFLLGALLATIGGIIGVVDAFRVSTVWGLLALFVPFALLVFCIKFWNQRKWARNSLVMSLLGLLAMIVPIPLAGGLGFLTARNAADQEFEDFTIEGEEVPPDGTATTPDAGPDGTTEVPAEGSEEAELFEEAMLPGLPTAAEIARAELLPSTDPNERFNEIDRERNDPYASVPIPPPPRPTPPPPQTGGGNGGGNAAGPGGGTLPAPTNRPGGAAAAPQPGGGAGATPGQGSTPRPGGGGQGSPPSSTPVEPLPQLPEPTVVASQVQITGVASVDGKTYAIVKAPNEPTSRYVQVGDRIANGTVLVKRIENRSGSAPVVVLEERGEEIALPVGANVGGAEEPTALVSPPAADIATLPILPPVQ